MSDTIFVADVPHVFLVVSVVSVSAGPDRSGLVQSSARNLLFTAGLATMARSRLDLAAAS